MAFSLERPRVKGPVATAVVLWRLNSPLILELVLPGQAYWGRAVWGKLILPLPQGCLFCRQMILVPKTVVLTPFASTNFSFVCVQTPSLAMPALVLGLTC